MTNISFASTLYRDTRNTQPDLYLDGKTCAIPSPPERPCPTDIVQAGVRYGRACTVTNFSPERLKSFSRAGWLKYQDRCPVRRQVTPTNFIAGPLWCILRNCRLLSKEKINNDYLPRGRNYIGDNLLKFTVRKKDHFKVDTNGDILVSLVI